MAYNILYSISYILYDILYIIYNIILKNAILHVLQMFIYNIKVYYT